jgi:RimJ/RimL family protein N-acetyltransferase
MTIELRTIVDDADLARLIEIHNAIEPRPVTVESFRAERAVAVAAMDLLAFDDGTIAGAGSVGWGPTGAESGTAFIGTWVLAGHRRRGVGAELYAAMADFARAGGMTKAHAFVTEDDGASLRFAERRGFGIKSRGQLGYLTLPGAPRPATAAPTDIRTTSLAERPELARALYELSMRVRPEIPALKDEPLPSFEAWRGSTIDDPGYSPDLSVIAVEADGSVAGALEVFDNADGTAFIGMTAVDPDARRRGIARCLKEELTRRAGAGGFHRIETYNDGANERIRGLNVDLGYVYYPTVLMLKAQIDDVAEAT